MVGVLLEEAKIDVTHSLPGSSTTQKGKSQQEILFIGCENMEKVCTPLRMVKASPIEIVAKELASIEKVEKELRPSSPQEEDNGEWEVQKKKRRGGKKLDIGSSRIARRPSSRVTRTKKIARDVASGKKLKLEIVTKGKK